MKSELSKAAQREQIERQVEDFLDQGGNVVEVERGASGRDDDSGPLQHLRSYEQRPRETRTPVPEVIAAIERRRQEAKKPRPKRVVKPRRGPVRRLVYDDFGEPLRYEWRDE